MAKTVKLVLASASPRRRDLLRDAGVDFDVVPAHLDEDFFENESPAEGACRLAADKARLVARLMPDRLVLGADTIVVLEETVLGKPRSLTQAHRMLKMLSGREHEVLTGVCLFRSRDNYEDRWVSTTRVRFKTLCDGDIQIYCNRIDPLDKAGGYAIQEYGHMLIESVNGLRSNVIGLPVEEVLERLKKFFRSAKNTNQESGFPF